MMRRPTAESLAKWRSKPFVARAALSYAIFLEPDFTDLDIWIGIVRNGCSHDHFNIDSGLF
jgi:hypothetical protein